LRYLVISRLLTAVHPDIEVMFAGFFGVEDGVVEEATVVAPPDLLRGHAERALERHLVSDGGGDRLGRVHEAQPDVSPHRRAKRNETHSQAQPELLRHALQNLQTKQTINS